MVFIEVTSYKDNGKIAINLATVTAFFARNGFTRIWLGQQDDIIDIAEDYDSFFNRINSIIKELE